MKSTSLFSHLLFIVFTTAPAALVNTAQATLIRYTFVDTVFEDGGTVSGYFDWDTTLPDITSVYDGWSANFAVSVAGGNESDFPPFTYVDEIEGPMTTFGDYGPFKPVLKFGDVFLGCPSAIWLSFRTVWRR